MYFGTFCMNGFLFWSHNFQLDKQAPVIANRRSKQISLRKFYRERYLHPNQHRINMRCSWSHVWLRRLIVSNYSPRRNNCFSMYHTGWINSTLTGLKRVSLVLFCYMYSFIHSIVLKKTCKMETQLRWYGNYYWLTFCTNYSRPNTKHTPRSLCLIVSGISLPRKLPWYTYLKPSLRKRPLGRDLGIHQLAVQRSSFRVTVTTCTGTARKILKWQG